MRHPQEAAVESFDTSESENTVRISVDVKRTLVNNESELQRAQADALRYKRQRDHQLQLVRIQCEEIIHTNALLRAAQKKNAVYETMVTELLTSIEMLSPATGGSKG